MTKHRIEFAVSLAQRVGELLRPGAGRAQQVRTKNSSVDLVTEYDERAEQQIVDAIERQFPGEAILTEESGHHGQGDALWVIDPLDGTTNFTHGIPFYCVSIAWLDGGEPRLGVVHAPALAETFVAQADQPAQLNGEPLAVSTTDELDRALLATGFPYDVRQRVDNNLDRYAYLALRARAVRRFGSAALDLCYVAAGRFDGYWEIETNPWDMAAGALAVLGCGGQVSDLAGRLADFISPASLVASNGLLHANLLNALKTAH